MPVRRARGHDRAPDIPQARLQDVSTIALAPNRDRVAAVNTREFFDSLESRVDRAKTAGMNNSYVFDIEGAGKWKVDVKDGNVSVTEGAEDGDVTITTSEETFAKITSGEQNATSAYMTGKLKVKGDMGAAMKLQKLF
jgi:alkyl sulfatase BDS1-like metallo-beta-lactamase superfamily hydrolase